MGFWYDVAKETMKYRFKARLWVYSGEGAWYFVTLPQDYANEIKELIGREPGFGSIKVTACIGEAEWQTSIFPDKKRHSYLLPIRKEIRSKLGIDTEDEVDVVLVIKNV
jgi:hypothetical protein